MTLIDELKERRTHVLEELNRVEDLRADLAEFDRVIAALEPVELVVTEITKDDAAEQLRGEWLSVSRELAVAEERVAELAVRLQDIERGIATLEEGENTVTWTEDQKPETWDTSEDDAVEIISDLTGDPAVEPESGLHKLPSEAELLAWAKERADAAAREAYLNPPITSPENAHLADDDGSDDPLYLSMLATEAAEKLPGGYAPVTNPEADAIASGIAYYSPAEQRARAAPWPGLGNLFSNKPKEPA